MLYSTLRQTAGPLARVLVMPRRCGGSIPHAADLEKRMLDTFRITADSEEAQALVNKVCQSYVESGIVTTEGVTEDDIAARFQQSDMPMEPVDMNTYMQDLIKKVAISDPFCHTHQVCVLAFCGSRTQHLTKLIFIGKS